MALEIPVAKVRVQVDRQVDRLRAGGSSGRGLGAHWGCDMGKIFEFSSKKCRAIYS